MYVIFDPRVFFSILYMDYSIQRIRRVTVGISTKYPKLWNSFSYLGRAQKKMVLEILLKILNGLFLMDLT